MNSYAFKNHTMCNCWYSSSESEVGCETGSRSEVEQLLPCGIGNDDVLGLSSSQVHCHNTKMLLSLKKV